MDYLFLLSQLGLIVVVVIATMVWIRLSLLKKQSTEINPLDIFERYPLRKLTEDLNYEIYRHYYIRSHQLLNGIGADGRTEFPSAINFIKLITDDENQALLGRIVSYVTSHIPSGFWSILIASGWRKEVIIEHITLQCLSLTRQMIARLGVDLTRVDDFNNVIRLFFEQQYFQILNTGIETRTGEKA